MDEPKTSAEQYALGLMVEEMGENLKLIGKALRFGLDAPGPNNEEYQGKTARQLLAPEVGDLHAAVRFAAMAGIFSMVEANVGEEAKLNRLLNPASVDSQGKRLAPDLSGLGFNEDHSVGPQREGRSIKHSHRAEGRNWID